jgi:hypothetical protein
MAMAESVVVVVNNEPAYVHCLSDRKRILVSFFFLSFFLSFSVSLEKIWGFAVGDIARFWAPLKFEKDDGFLPDFRSTEKSWLHRPAADRSF